MTTATRARWFPLSTCLLLGCSSLSNLFSSDGEQTTPDAGLTTLPPTGLGPDSAPAVSIPEQPAPSVEVEAPAIKAVVSSLSLALAGRDVETATAQFTSEVRTWYRTMLASATPEKLDMLAVAIAQLNVTTVVAGSVDSAELRGEGTVTLDGRTFRSPEVTIQGPAPESLLTRWQAKTGAVFEFTGPLIYDDGSVQSTDPPGLTFAFMSMLGTGITWSGNTFNAKKVTTTGPISMPGDRETTFVETLTLKGTLSADGRTLLAVRAEDIQVDTSVYLDGHSEESKDTAILEAKDLPLTAEYSGQFSIYLDVRSHVVHIEQTDSILKQSSINNAQWDQAALTFSFQ